MEEPDLFRGTWVRYLGYANEVGEAFRNFVPSRVVRASYAVAFGYVLADTTHKTAKMYEYDKRPNKVAIAAGDALLWQTLASVIIPGFTINRLCHYTSRSLTSMPKLPRAASQLITTSVGLLAIPIIIHPIDHAVTTLMELTYRKWF